jgi:hypothetical protein
MPPINRFVGHKYFELLGGIDGYFLFILLVGSSAAQVK